MLRSVVSTGPNDDSSMPDHVSNTITDDKCHEETNSSDEFNENYFMEQDITGLVAQCNSKENFVNGLDNLDGPSLTAYSSNEHVSRSESVGQSVEVVCSDSDDLLINKEVDRAVALKDVRVRKLNALEDEFLSKKLAKRNSKKSRGKKGKKKVVVEVDSDHRVANASLSHGDFRRCNCLFGKRYESVVLGDEAAAAWI